MLSFGVEADFDAIRIVQPDQHRSSVVTGDHTAVLLSGGVEVLRPRLHVVAGRDRQGHRVEAGQGRGAFGVQPQSQPQRAVAVGHGQSAELAVLGELDLDMESEDALVPVPAGGQVADR